MKILYCYPYCGELGWEIFNWRPHVCYIHAKHGPFSHSFASVRAGREGIYRSLVREFETFDDYDDCTEGNAFVVHRPDAYDAYKTRCVAHDARVKKLEANGHEVTVVRLPKSYYRYHRFKVRHRRYEPLLPDPKVLKHWSAKIESTAVVFHMRHITRSKRKNTQPDVLAEAGKWASKNKRQMVVIGLTPGMRIKFKVPGLNLMNKTTMDDLLAIYNRCGIVIGSSSGPVHLAAATNTPHVAWGGVRAVIEARYRKKWNPFDVPIVYITRKFTVSAGQVRGALSQLATNALTDSARRNEQCVSS